MKFLKSKTGQRLTVIIAVCLLIAGGIFLALGTLDPAMWVRGAVCMVGAVGLLVYRYAFASRKNDDR